MISGLIALAIAVSVIGYALAAWLVESPSHHPRAWLSDEQAEAATLAAPLLDEDVRQQLHDYDPQHFAAPTGPRLVVGARRRAR